MSSSRTADDAPHLPDDAVLFASRAARVGREPQVTAARLVLRAAAPWSPASHWLWPVRARAFVRALLHIAHHIAVPNDVWAMHVMPHLVRRCGPIPRWEDEDAGESA